MFGALISGGLIALAGLIGQLIFDLSRVTTGVVTAVAIAAGLAGGMTAVGWVQGWRDTVRHLGASRANSESVRKFRWPASLEHVQERIVALAEQRDDAILGRTFAQQRLDAVISGLRDGVLVIGPDLTVISINEAACRMLEGAPQNAVGRPLIEVARDFDLVRVVEETVSSGHEQSTPVDYRRSGRQFHLRVVPVDQRGRRMAVVVVQDVTDLRRLERVRTDFVANVSHELRTPLAAIRALVETLNEGAINDESVAHGFLGQVVEEVDRLNELIEDLLDLGRLESGRLPLRRTQVDAAVLVQQSIERVTHLAEDAGVQFRVDVDGALPPIFVDTSRMTQVLVNLLSNAIKFSPRGGTIEICLAREDGAVRLAVRDRGTGILPEDLPRIFERFYKADRSRHSGGSGLGLAIARHIVTAHGGHLTAESEYGSGSTFTVQLPVAEPSAATGAGIERVLDAVAQDVEGEDS